MDGTGSFSFHWRHGPVDRDWHWHLAVDIRIAEYPNKFTARNLAASCVGKYQPRLNQSQHSHSNCWCNLDVVRHIDFHPLSKRKSKTVYGGCMSRSLQNIPGLDRVIHEPA